MRAGPHDAGAVAGGRDVDEAAAVVDGRAPIGLGFGHPLLVEHPACSRGVIRCWNLYFHYASAVSCTVR